MSESCLAALVDSTGNLPMLFWCKDGGGPNDSPGAASLDRFCDMIREGQIRRNVRNAGGWLILVGAAERASITQPGVKLEDYCPLNQCDAKKPWLVGTWEPIPWVPDDADWVHLVDLTSATWESSPVGPEKPLQSSGVLDWIANNRPPAFPTLGSVLTTHEAESFENFGTMPERKPASAKRQKARGPR